MLAGPPPSSIETPEAVRALIKGRPYEVVWLNGLGDLTFLVRDPTSNIYVKWFPDVNGIDVATEVEKLRWAAQFVAVPVPLEYGSSAEGSWIVTEAIEAENAVSARWKREPRTAASGLGAGLRAFHDALSTKHCPYEWSITRRLEKIYLRVEDGSLHDHQWSEDFSGLTLDAALAELYAAPKVDLVVCHGDACAPNTLLDDHGHYRAHVDLANLGVADRWADLAILTWSTVWNYGAGWEKDVYASYGVEPDLEKIRFYRLVWELEG